MLIYVNVFSGADADWTFFPPLPPWFLVQNVAAGVEKKWKQTVYNHKCWDAHVAEGKLKTASDGAWADWWKSFAVWLRREVNWRITFFFYHVFHKKPADEGKIAALPILIGFMLSKVALYVQ